MSQTAAERAAAAAARAAERAAARTTPAEPSPGTDTLAVDRHRPHVQTTKTRVTVDFQPVDFHNLNDWLTEAAKELGVSRVTKQDVIKTLVKRLITDETLARKIRDDIQKGS